MDLLSIIYAFILKEELEFWIFNSDTIVTWLPKLAQQIRHFLPKFGYVNIKLK